MLSDYRKALWKNIDQRSVAVICVKKHKYTGYQEILCRLGIYNPMRVDLFCETRYTFATTIITRWSYNLPREYFEKDEKYLRQRLNSANVNILHKKTVILVISVKNTKVAFLIFSLLFFWFLQSFLVRGYFNQSDLKQKAQENHSTKK